jgi:hypothetical protein
VGTVNSQFSLSEPERTALKNIILQVEVAELHIYIIIVGIWKPSMREDEDNVGVAPTGA